MRPLAFRQSDQTQDHQHFDKVIQSHLNNLQILGRREVYVLLIFHKTTFWPIILILLRTIDLSANYMNSKAAGDYWLCIIGLVLLMRLKFAVNQNPSIYICGKQRATTPTDTSLLESLFFSFDIHFFFFNSISYQNFLSEIHQKLANKKAHHLLQKSHTNYVSAFYAKFHFCIYHFNPIALRAIIARNECNRVKHIPYVCILLIPQDFSKWPKTSSCFIGTKYLHTTKTLPFIRQYRFEMFNLKSSVVQSISLLIL